MIWYICAAIAAVLMALSVIAYLNKHNGSLRVVVVLLCLVLATYAIYVPIFHAAHDFWLGTIGNLIHTLQVIIIDADITDIYDSVLQGIPNDTLAKAYITLVCVLHIVLPAMSALTAATVLFRCFSSIQLRIANNNQKPVFVFSEVNERSLQLAKSLEKVKGYIVFTNSSEDSLSNENSNQLGYVYKDEEIAELNIRSKRNKDMYFFCISDDEDTSLGDTLKLIEKYADQKEAKQEHIHIFQFSKHQDFSVFIDSADKGSLDVRCINEYEILIYNLLDQYPLFRFAEKNIHVLLCGLSPINIVALRAAAWCGQLSGFTTKISVVGVDIAQKIQDIRLAFPGLFSERYDIRAYSCSSEEDMVRTIGEKCADANYILVSGETDNAVMERGISLRRLFYRLDPTFRNCPPIFCYIKEPSKFNIIQKLATAESKPDRKMHYQLIPYGSLTEVYTYERLVDSQQEALAKNVHLAYEEIFSDAPIDVKEALKRYNVFEVNKRSNRANALHIRYKLRLLGLDYTTDPDAQEVCLKEYLAESMEKLSRAEHDRWMAFLEAEGWLPATKDEVYAYRNSGISKGRHNCPLLKMHPYICPYDDLKELSIDLEGKDTTVYDEELIRRIPDILGDKWNVSGKKYKIVPAEKISG